MSTERLARACARRPWTTLGAWVLALVLGIGTIVALLDLTSEGELTSNPESERGYDAIGRHFPPDPNEEYVNELILIRSGTSTVDDPAFQDKVGALLAEVESSGVTNNAESFYESGDASLVSADRSATLIPVGLRGDCEEGAARRPASSKPPAQTSSTSSCRASAAPTTTSTRSWIRT